MLDSTTPEEWVLNIILRTHGEAMDDITLIPDDFERVDHARIFEHMKRLRSAGVIIEPLVLAEAAPRDVATIWQLHDVSLIPVGVEHYAGLVRARATRRRLGELGIALQGLEDGLDADQMVEYARSNLDRLSGPLASNYEMMADLVAPALAEVVDRPMFTPTIWPSLNEAIGGLKPGALIVVGARPGIGKTVVGLNLAMGLSRTGTVAFATLEMSAKELTLRGVATLAEVNVDALTRGRLSQEDWGRVADAKSHFQARVAIDARADVGPAQLRSFARTVQKRGDLVAVVVDYLQLMTMQGKESRQEKVAEFSRQLKLLAKDLQVPVIALSQLNRRSTNTVDGKPTLADLRESGSIEQDADVVILLSRPDDTPESIFFDVAKNRHGRMSVVDMLWRGNYARIDDWQWSNPGQTNPWRQMASQQGGIS